MSVESTLASLISGQTNAGTRVYPIYPPQDPTYPFLLYSANILEPSFTMSGRQSLQEYEAKIEVWALTDSEVVTIQDDLVDTLDGYGSGSVHRILHKDTFREETEQGFHGTVSFRFFYSE